MHLISRMTKSIVPLFLCTFALIANEPKIVHLTPPQLTNETLSEKIVCTRPMREGKFNISLEKQKKKTIVHCYGHGGSGATTVFGSVKKAIDLFEKTHPNKSKPIRVIGSGYMGLTTAIELKRLGYNVAGITTKEFYDLPSWKAAGYFALVSVKTSPEEQADLNEIGLHTFQTYQQIDQGDHPYISKETVRFLPVYCSADTESGVEDLEARGFIPPRENVTLDFGNGVVHPDYIEYMTYFINTTNLMHQLIDEVNRLGIHVEFREVQSFNDVKEKAIFNCTGLGARELNKDSHMIPVRGHLVTMNDDAGTAHMDYMIYTKVEQDGKDEYIYLFPKTLSVTPEHTQGMPCVGVLGGTFIPHADKLSSSEQAALNESEFKRLLDRNSMFFHGHPFQD